MSWRQWPWPHHCVPSSLTPSFPGINSQYAIKDAFWGILGQRFLSWALRSERNECQLLPQRLPEFLGLYRASIAAAMPLNGTGSKLGKYLQHSIPNFPHIIQDIPGCQSFFSSTLASWILSKQLDGKTNPDFMGIRYCLPHLSL